MNLSEVIYDPKAGIKITLDELGMLECLADHHYDATCRLSCKQGGFIYGMKNREKYAPGNTHILTQREVQLLVKITEYSRSMAMVFVDKTAFAILQSELLEVLKELNNKERMPKWPQEPQSPTEEKPLQKD